MKTKKLLASLLALALLLSCMTVPAFADGATELTASKTTWSDGDNLIVSSGTLTMSGPVTVTGNVTLTIANGATLKINGTNGSNGANGTNSGVTETEPTEEEEEPRVIITHPTAGKQGNAGGNAITVSSGSLTITGSGTLNTQAGNGGNGGAGGSVGDEEEVGSDQGQAGASGGSGGSGIYIAGTATVTVQNVTITANGGAGGTGGKGGNCVQNSAGDGGIGGIGGTGISVADTATMTVQSGTVTATGGNAGDSGNGGASESDTVGSSAKGGEAGSGISIATGASVSVQSAIVTATGGKGGNGGNIGAGSMNDGTSGGWGGNGGNGITANGSLTNNGGTLKVDGGILGEGGRGMQTDDLESYPGGYELGNPGNHGWGYSGILNMSSGNFSSYQTSTSSGYANITNKGITGGLFNFKVDAKNIADGYECVQLGKDNYKVQAAGSTLTSASAGLPTEKTGGVTFTVGGNTATIAKKDATVTVTAIAVEGYTATLTAKDADNAVVELTESSTKGVYTFKMPDKAVTVTATYAPITTGSIDLDLEDGTTDISDSKDVKQYYTKSTASDTVYKHKILVNWDDAPMEIKVADAKEWDYNNLKWITDTDNDGVATVVEDTNVKTFTLTNYSAKAFTCKLEFAAETDLAGKFDSYTVKDKDSTDVTTSGVTLDAVINDTSKTTTDEKYLDGEDVVYTDLPTATMTATVNPKLEGDGSFANADATEEATKYGTFTITCTVAGD